MVNATQKGKVYEIAGETVIGPRKPGYSHGVNIESIRPTIAELERFARWYSEQVILEDIQHPVTVQIGGQKSAKKDATAHFSKSRIVDAADAEKFGVSEGIYGGWQTREGVAVHEIMLVAELLDAEPIEVLHRMAHEMVHLWMAENGEKGTAASGRHNKLFAERAESVGLVVFEHEKQTVGYSTSGFTSEMVDRIEQEFGIDVQAFNLSKSAAVPKKASRTSTVAFKHESDETQPTLRVAAGKAADFAPLAKEIGYYEVA